MKEKYKKRAVRQLKACGQEIVKSAETMFGGYDFQLGEVRITITLSDNKAPEINVHQELMPDPKLWMEE